MSGKAKLIILQKFKGILSCDKIIKENGDINITMILNNLFQIKYILILTVFILGCYTGPLNLKPYLQQMDNTPKIKFGSLNIVEFDDKIPEKDLHDFRFFNKPIVTWNDYLLNSFRNSGVFTEVFMTGNSNADYNLQGAVISLKTTTGFSSNVTTNCIALFRLIDNKTKEVFINDTINVSIADDISKYKNTAWLVSPLPIGGYSPGHSSSCLFGKRRDPDYTQGCETAMSSAISEGIIEINNRCIKILSEKYYKKYQTTPPTSK